MEHPSAILPTTTSWMPRAMPRIPTRFYVGFPGPTPEPPSIWVVYLKRRQGCEYRGLPRQIETLPGSIKAHIYINTKIVLKLMKRIYWAIIRVDLHGVCPTRFWRRRIFLSTYFVANEDSQNTEEHDGSVVYDVVVTSWVVRRLIHIINPRIHTHPHTHTQTHTHN